jgi:hypothetical protein
MADYGIFGHGSSGNGWFTNKLRDFHESTKKYDPLGHYSVENPMKAGDWLVEKSSGALADAGIGEGFNTRLNQEANQNGNDWALSATRAGTGAATVIGGMYGYGALSGGGAGAGAGGSAGAGSAGAGVGAEAAPTALGYGTEGMSAYTMPASDGVSVGSWFDINGLPEGSKFASDIPTNNPTWDSMTKSPMGSMGGMMQSSGGQSGGRSGSMRQNLPLYENEKTEQQKLAELLDALQQQNGGYA